MLNWLFGKNILFQAWWLVLLILAKIRKYIKFPWDAFPAGGLFGNKLDACYRPRPPPSYQSAILCNNLLGKRLSTQSLSRMWYVCSFYRTDTNNSLLSLRKYCPIKICSKCVMFNVNTKRVVHHQYCMMMLLASRPRAPRFLYHKWCIADNEMWSQEMNFCALSLVR